MIIPPTGEKRRGRPTGWRKPDRRERRDYRFKPETLRILDEPRESQDETAFVEAAILHYASHQAEQAQIATYVAEINNLREWGTQAQARITLLEAENHKLRARAVQQTPTTPPAQRRKALYQVLVRHAPGRCPGNFGHADLEHDSQCPVHVAYSAQLGIELARKAARDMRDRQDIMKCWITKDGYSTGYDSWVRKDDGSWIRDN